MRMPRRVTVFSVASLESNHRCYAQPRKRDSARTPQTRAARASSSLNCARSPDVRGLVFGATTHRVFSFTVLRPRDAYRLDRSTPDGVPNAPTPLQSCRGATAKHARNVECKRLVKGEPRAWKEGRRRVCFHRIAAQRVAGRGRLFEDGIVNHNSHERSSGQLRFVFIAGVVILAGLTLQPVSLHAQQRGIPRAVRRALVGCWVPWEGERWTIREHGSTGLTQQIHLDIEILGRRWRRARVRPSVGPESIVWFSARSEAHLACGPTTQHGQFCRARLNDDGDVDVDLYVRRHNPRRNSARLVSTTRARRCE